MKTRKRPRKSVNHVSIMFVIDGQAVDYQRTEYDDGSYVEVGLPEGMPPRPSINELIEHAMRQSDTVSVSASFTRPIEYTRSAGTPSATR